jgi:hypothetical protein
MDDDFLYRIRPPVRKVFADSLRQRLTSRYPDNRTRRKGTSLMNQSLANSLTWKFALVVFLVVLALVFTLSGQVRARALEWIKIVAGFTVEERSESPLKDLEEGIPIPSQTDSQPTTTGMLLQTEKATSTEIPPVVVYQVPVISVPEALENPPFPLSLPTWIPEGYTLNEQVAIANSKDWIMLTWSNPKGREIAMLVEREYTGYNIPAGVDSSQEIKINGQPALLIHGNWDSQHQWDPQRGIAIYWIKDGHDYRLIYSEREPVRNVIQPVEGDMEAITAELVHMAESIP